MCRLKEQCPHRMKPERPKETLSVVWFLDEASERSAWMGRGLSGWMR